MCISGNNNIIIIIITIKKMIKREYNIESYQQFQNRIKTKFRRQKQQRKGNLRPIQLKKIVQSSQDSNDQQYLKKTSNRWWNRISRHYFLKINDQFVENMRNFTTSDDIVEIGVSQCYLMNYYREIICQKGASMIFQDDTIRILFSLYDKLQQKQKHILAGYLVKPVSAFNRLNDTCNSYELPNIYSFHPPLQTPSNTVALTKPQINFQYQNEPLKNSTTIPQQSRICVQQQPPFLNSNPPFQSQLHQHSPSHYHHNNINTNSNRQQPLQIDITIHNSLTQSQPYIQKCLQYQTIWRKQNITEIQKQIQCWKLELQYQHTINLEKWDYVQQKIQEQREIYGDKGKYGKGIQSRVQDIKKMLVRSQTFNYFRAGYADKTAQDFSSTLPYIPQKNYKDAPKISTKSSKKQSQFFQTDCKVCFCTKNEPSNKVIYCDMCSTSFHQSCYGIQHLDQSKQLLCDVCQYIRKLQHQNKGTKYEHPSCQICGRSKFPIKNLNNHFYHISCLILFNFAQLHQFKLTLLPSITHTSIMQKVIQNQLQHDYCQYCIKNVHIGMKIKCSVLFCNKCYHPICAYLNGCIFNIKRKNKGLYINNKGNNRRKSKSKNISIDKDKGKQKQKITGHNNNASNYQKQDKRQNNGQKYTQQRKGIDENNSQSKNKQPQINQQGDIQVTVRCREHGYSEQNSSQNNKNPNNQGIGTFNELALQVYLRRYLCNYRLTADHSQQQFRQMYRKQLQRVAIMRNNDLEQGGVKRIMKLKRFKSNVENSNKRNDSLKKSLSLISNGSSNKDSKVKKVQSSSSQKAVI